MKQRISKLLLALITSIMSIQGFAYDFEVDGIYYNKLSDETSV